LQLLPIFDIVNNYLSMPPTRTCYANLCERIAKVLQYLNPL